MEARRRVVRKKKEVGGRVGGGAGVNTVTSISSGATLMQPLSAYPSPRSAFMVTSALPCFPSMKGTDLGSGLNEPHVYLEFFCVERKKQH